MWCNMDIIKLNGISYASNTYVLISGTDAAVIDPSADIKAIKDALGNMEEGKLYFSAIDMSEYFKDKRDLISKEDLPETASLKFVPASGTD